ncbi:MAG: T9SS type A sorting domain-containing protein, partial [Bacteroidia bacterium]
NDGYRLQGENGLSFNLDSAFNVTNHTYTQPWESIWMPDGAISYHQTKSGYRSITMQVTDSSDFNGFPQNFTINTLNLLRLRKYDTNANLTDERISRLPNKYDSAFVRILKNDTVVYENNLKLSNPNLASFNSNNNGESIYGYYKVNNFLDLNEDNRYSLLLFDSAFNLKNANNFYEEKTTLINSVLLENNGNIWVSGFQKGSIPTKNYLRLITKEEFYTGHKNQETHNKQLSIFPNPANNFIQLNNLPNNCHVKIYNLSGKLVKSVSTINSSLLNVNIEEHECGIYFIDASTQNGEIYRGKFVINR